MNIASRLKQARKEKGYTQDALANAIGVSRGVITNIEYGKVEPQPLVIRAICDVLTVDEHWLRTGEGEMFKPKSHEEELAEFMADIMKEADATFRARLISVMSQLSFEEWQAVEKVVMLLAKNAKDLTSE